MWPRAIEIMLGCWLALSPFIFQHAAGETALWVVDLGGATLVITLALFSFWKKTAWAHFAIVAVAAGLIAFGYLYQPHPAPPALQNNVLVGWLLIMFAIMPNQINIPPRSWREYNQDMQPVSLEGDAAGEAAKER